jgi:hypothetical protein
LGRLLSSLLLQMQTLLLQSRSLLLELRALHLQFGLQAAYACT